MKSDEQRQEEISTHKRENARRSKTEEYIYDRVHVDKAMKLDGEVVFDTWDNKEFLLKRLKSLFEGIFNSYFVLGLNFRFMILLFSLLGEKEWLT